MFRGLLFIPENDQLDTLEIEMLLKLILLVLKIKFAII